MKFDYVIGNPPFQETLESTSDKPVYNLFMDQAFSVSDKVELVHPARFLFNAGKTPKQWNEKMLNDKHYKVLYYEPLSQKVFSNTNFKGGVAITYRDVTKEFGAIENFSIYKEMNEIVFKMKKFRYESFSEIIYSPESYRFTSKLYEQLPEIRNMTFEFKGKIVPLISKGHDYDLTTNIFDKLENIVFFENEDVDVCYEIVGRKSKQRVSMWIKKEFIADHENLSKYKVILPKANGNGTLGETLTDPFVKGPGVGHTQTYISIGSFDAEDEAIAVLTYLKTKFLRTLLSALKVTQDNKKSVWKLIPLQDFTSSSDIDWSQSIADIDKQLYKKYGLSQEEIDFIETHVKEME